MGKPLGVAGVGCLDQGDIQLASCFDLLWPTTPPPPLHSRIFNLFLESFRIILIPYVLYIFIHVPKAFMQMTTKLANPLEYQRMLKDSIPSRLCMSLLFIRIYHGEISCSSTWCEQRNIMASKIWLITWPPTPWSSSQISRHCPT